MDNSFIFLQIFSRMRNTKPWCSTWTRVSWWRRAWMTPFFPSSRKSSSSGKRRRRRRRRSWGRPRWSLLNVSSSHFGLVLQLMSTSSAILWGPRRPSVNSTRSGEKKKILDKFFLTTHLPPSISGQSGEIYKLDLIFQVFFFSILFIDLFVHFFFAGRRLLQSTLSWGGTWLPGVFREMMPSSPRIQAWGRSGLEWASSFWTTPSAVMWVWFVSMWNLYFLEVLAGNVFNSAISCSVSQKYIEFRSMGKIKGELIMFVFL